MAVESVGRYFDFYRANLNGEKTLKGSLVLIYNAACMPLIYWLLYIRRNQYMSCYCVSDGYLRKIPFRGQVNFSRRTSGSGNLPLLSTGIFRI